MRKQETQLKNISAFKDTKHFKYGRKDMAMETQKEISKLRLRKVFYAFPENHTKPKQFKLGARAIV